MLILKKKKFEVNKLHWKIMTFFKIAVVYFIIPSENDKQKHTTLHGTNNNFFNIASQHNTKCLTLKTTQEWHRNGLIGFFFKKWL